jgi:PIN domain nuclease of toxin-antitoxin system
MRLLLDTHAFLWFILDHPRLSIAARDYIADRDNIILISPVTYWEIAIKISLGKYELPEPYSDFMERELESNNFQVLPIEPRHTAVLIDLPFHHRDPFDRLLVAQALVENIPLVSIDKTLDGYSAERVW